MRKALFILYLLFSLVCLNALVFRSNQLGQKLEQISFRTDVGYELVEEPSSLVLLYDGNPVWEEYVMQTADNGHSVVRSYKGSDRVETRTYSDGRLVMESVSGTGEGRTNYSYNDGHLVLSTHIDSSNPVSVTSFLRSADNGRIVGVSEDGTIRLLSEMFIVQDGVVIQSIAPNLVVTGDHNILEDGTILIEENGQKLIYDMEGKLLSSISGEQITTYSYKDGSLEAVETILGSRRSVENYRDGKPFELFVYVGEELESHTEYRENGNVMTLYSDGRKIAVVYYKKDNRTVDRIEYN